MTSPKLREDCIHINVCHVIGEYGTKGCVKSCPEYINHSSAKSDAVLDELENLISPSLTLIKEHGDWDSGYKGGIIFALSQINELRSQQKEREQG